MKKLWAVLLLITGVAGAAEIPEGKIIANETALAYNNTYVMGLHNTKAISMQVIYTSATVASQTFTDGRASTFTITVASNTFLSTATATMQITIASNTALGGSIWQPAVLFFNGRNLTNGVEWTYDASFSTNTACSLAAAIATYTAYSSTCTGSVVYSTAPTYGAVWNQGVQSSTQAALTVSSTTGSGHFGFNGGKNAEFFTINGTKFTAGQQFTVGSSSAATAANIYAAINSTTTGVGLIVVSTTTGTSGVVVATSTAVGTATTYALTTSSQAALSLSPASAAFGGANSGYSLATSRITIANHGFTTALPVLYSGSPAIGGLTTGTTYYPVIIDANTIGLSSTSAVAQTGAFITLTSSATPTTTDTYTLAPLAITGTPSFKWQVSNDKTNWVDYTANTYNISISSVTMSAYTFGGATTVWDPGQMDYGWLRLNVVGPTTGGIYLQAWVEGKP